MNRAVRAAITTLFPVVLAVNCLAQSGKELDIEFHAPFRTPHADSSQEFRDKYFLGDWRGERSKLANRGIEFALLSIIDPFGNVTGGKVRGASDYDLVAVGALLDTDRLLGWHGGTIHLGYAVNFGTSLSKNYINNSFPVQLADVADAHPRLTYLSYTQNVFEGKLSVRLGRLTINSVSHEEFLGSEYFKAFTSVGVDLVPLGLFLNAPGAFGYPDTTWGARIKFQPARRFYTMTAAYNGDPRLKEGAQHGLDFSMRGPLFLISESGFHWDDPKAPSTFSRSIKFGAYYNGGERTRYGLYILGDQVLSRWGELEQGRRLGVFGAFVVAPDQRANKVPYFFDTGLASYGPLRSRPRDFAGLAVVYGSYSRNLPQVDEMALEWNYAFEIRPGFLLQPDMQYLVHPNGNKTTPNALAIGANIVINW